jgi:hypothetical protein
LKYLFRAIQRNQSYFNIAFNRNRNPLESSLVDQFFRIYSTMFKSPFYSRSIVYSKNGAQIIIIIIIIIMIMIIIIIIIMGKGHFYKNHNVEIQKEH